MPIRSLISSLCDIAAVGQIHLEQCQLGTGAARFLVEAGGASIVPSRNGPCSIVSNVYDTLNPLPTSGFLDFHTDGLYCEPIPDFVVFYCEEPGDFDCHTLLADTRIALQHLKDAALLEKYKKLQVAYMFDSPSEKIPLITDHPLTTQPIIHLASNYIREEQAGIDQSITQVYRALEKSIVCEHNWKRGDLLVFDNHSFVHRRQNTQPDVRRRLIRLWLRACD